MIKIRSQKDANKDIFKKVTYSMNKKYLIRKHEISIPELIGIGECRVLDS